MALKITRYSPDTCSCVLEYSWDDTVSSDQRVHTPTTIIQRCSAHSSVILPTKEGVFNAVVEIENPRKCYSLQKILDNGPTSLYDLQQDGSRTFKQNINVSWTWSGTAPNRILTITVTGTTLTANQKNNIQSALDNFFGVGNVIIVNP